MTLRGLKIADEVATHVIEIARELVLEMETEYGTELLQSHDKNLKEWRATSDGWAKKNGLLRWNLLLVKMLWNCWNDHKKTLI